MQKLTGEKLKAVWTEFSTLSLAVFVMRAAAWYTQGQTHLELKTLLRFSPVSLSLSMKLTLLKPYRLKI